VCEGTIIKAAKTITNNQVVYSWPRMWKRGGGGPGPVLLYHL